MLLFFVFEVPPFLFSTRSRGDVQTCTPWKAPIIWEGMFDPDLYDRAHQKGGTSVALTVFAVGRWVRDSLCSSDSFSISFSSEISLILAAADGEKTSFVAHDC